MRLRYEYEYGDGHQEGSSCTEGKYVHERADQRGRREKG